MRLEYRIDYLVNYLVEVFFLDAAETTLYVALDVTRNNLALDKAWLREREAHNHFVGQGVGILRIEPVVRRDKHKIEHTVLVLLQLVVGNYNCGMGLNVPSGKRKLTSTMSL